MRLSLLTIGKTKQPFVRDGIAFYQKRLAHYYPFELIELPEIKGARKMPEAELRAHESERMLKVLDNDTLIVALDEHGRRLGSRAFADWLQGRMNAGARRIAFCVGGAYGHGPELLARARLTLSLSDMTFPHDLVRLLFSEQLYRACTILRGEPYHHE